MNLQTNYLNWLSSTASMFKVDNFAFSCVVYKVHEYMDNDYIEVISIGNIQIHGAKVSNNPALLEFTDFVEFVDEHNPRTVTFVTEAPMFLFPLVEKGFEIVDALIDGVNSRITLFKRYQRVVRNPT